MMTYYTQVLEPGETVRFIGELHWIRYLPGALMIGVALGILITAGWQSEARAATEVGLSGLVGVLALWSLAANWIRQRTTEIVITDRRVIRKTGLVSRHTQEINVSKVETVLVSQGLLGRLLDYGTVTIKGTGGGWEPLALIRQPLRLRSAIIAA